MVIKNCSHSSCIHYTAAEYQHTDIPEEESIQSVHLYTYIYELGYVKPDCSIATYSLQTHPWALYRAVISETPVCIEPVQKSCRNVTIIVITSRVRCKSFTKHRMNDACRQTSANWSESTAQLTRVESVQPMLISLHASLQIMRHNCLKTDVQGR